MKGHDQKKIYEAYANETVINPDSIRQAQSSLDVAETEQDREEIEKVLRYLQSKIKEPSRIENIINLIKKRFYER
jgi:hypothetical protein